LGAISLLHWLVSVGIGLVVAGLVGSAFAVTIGPPGWLIPVVVVAVLLVITGMVLTNVARRPGVGATPTRPNPRPGVRTGVKMRGGRFVGSDVTIRNMDTAISNDGGDVWIQRGDIR
jgi:hypothetical protein